MSIFDYLEQGQTEALIIGDITRLIQIGDPHRVTSTIP